MIARPDADLVGDIQQGLAGAETALYERYAARVYYVALRGCQSAQDAEDVRAETFVRVLEAVRGRQVRSAGALAAFILGVTRNVLHELYARRRQSRGGEGQQEEPAMAPSHEKAFLDDEVRAAVASTLSRLRPRDRAVLRMQFFDDLPTAEIARRVGIAPNRVRLVKSRALKRFRELYSRSPAAARHRS